MDFLSDILFQFLCFAAALIVACIICILILEFLKAKFIPELFKALVVLVVFISAAASVFYAIFFMPPEPPDPIENEYINQHISDWPR